MRAVSVDGPRVAPVLVTDKFVMLNLDDKVRMEPGVPGLLDDAHPPPSVSVIL